MLQWREKVTVCRFLIGYILFRLCADIVDLLTSLIDSRAEYLSRGTQLYDFLCKIDLAKLPSKTKLMKALVLIAAQVDDQTVQQRMYEQVSIAIGFEILQCFRFWCH